MINRDYGSADIAAWNQYKSSPTPENREALLNRFDGLIQNHVNKWAGNVPRDVLNTEAKILASKAFDTYNPGKGTALATHVTNNMLPLSRIVYTYQNSTRMPENITIKMHEYNAAKTHLNAVYGREPTVTELNKELGWGTSEIERLQQYDRKNLVESCSNISGEFYNNKEVEDDEDTALMNALHSELSPDEQKLFDCTTGWGGRPVMSNPQIMQELGLSQAQLSYQKTLLTKKLQSLMQRPSIRKRYANS